jgi:hypothetical protein
MFMCVKRKEEMETGIINGKWLKAYHIVLFYL